MKLGNVLVIENSKKTLEFFNFLQKSNFLDII